MKVLITGGAGFIGSHIADALIARGDDVVILDNLDPQIHLSGQWPNYLNPKCRLVQGDVRDGELLDNLLATVDSVIFNAAAVGVGQSMYAINHYTDVNCRGSAVFWESLLKHRENVKKVVLASSMSIYGEGSYVNGKGVKSIPVELIATEASSTWEKKDHLGNLLKPEATTEEKKIEPSSIYAISKHTQEEMFLILGKTYGVPVVALRYFNVIGTRQSLSNPYTGVAAIFCSRLLNGNPPMIFEDGLQMRDFVDVRDIVQANLLALDNSSITNNYFNIGSGAPITISNLAKKIAEALNLKIEPIILNKSRAGDIRHCYANIDKAKEILKYQPKYLIEDSVRDLVAWLGNQIAIDKVEDSYTALCTNNLVK